MQIAFRHIDEFKPYVRNSRTHGAEQIAQICSSMREFGWTNPVLADRDGNVSAGHGRLEAAKLIYSRGESLRDPTGQDIIPGMVPWIDCTGWTEQQRKAYVIADNKIAEQAGWDKNLLRLELLDLRVAKFDIGLTGFAGIELGAILADPNKGQTDPDDVPDVPLDPISRPGDVWLLDGHRLVCGDSTNAETVGKALNGTKPHLMVTDPPYGVAYDANWRTNARNGNGELLSSGTGRATGAVSNDDRADWSAAWDLFPGEVGYVWHAGNKAHIVAESLIVTGFNIRAQIVWAKSNFVISRGDYHPQHEPCWYAVKKGATGHWQGDRKQSTLWSIPKPQKSETGHSTQKPVECMQRPMENNSKPGQIVYEPFSGSGTTIIAGERCGRKVYAIELNPAYVDLAVERWQAFSGKTAVLEATGQPYDAVRAARRAAVPALATEQTEAA